MSRLFKRFISLSLIRPKIEIDRGGFGFFQELPNVVTITAMEVKFKIEKNLGKHPNKASITITNLAETTRAQIQKVPLIVQLSVGYDGAENLAHLFSGDLRIADTVNNGPHVETTLEMGEGDRAFQYAFASQAYSQSTVFHVVSDTIGKLGLPVPPGLDLVKELKLPYTGTIHAPAERALTELLTPAGISWSIQDGRFVPLKDTQAREGEAIVIREGDGMVGSPKITAAKKPGETPSLHAKLLIDPRVVAGCKVDVRSRDVNGVFRVERVEHTGDFRGKEWYTEIRGKHL